MVKWATHLQYGQKQVKHNNNNNGGGLNGGLLRLGEPQSGHDFAKLLKDPEGIIYKLLL